MEQETVLVYSGLKFARVRSTMAEKAYIWQEQEASKRLTCIHSQKVESGQEVGWAVKHKGPPTENHSFQTMTFPRSTTS